MSGSCDNLDNCNGSERVHFSTCWVHIGGTRTQVQALPGYLAGSSEIAVDGLACHRHSHLQGLPYSHHHMYN